MGDGGAGPYYGLFPLDGKVDFPEYIDERTIPGLLGTPFPHNAEWNPHQGDRSTWISDDEYFDDRWSAGSMAICDYGCGYFFRLVVTGQLAGQVWFDSRACDGGLRPGPDFWHWYLVWLDPQRPQ